MNLQTVEEATNGHVLVDVTEAAERIVAAKTLDAQVADLTKRLTSVEEQLSAWTDPEDHVYVPIQDAWVWTEGQESIRVVDGNHLLISLPWLLRPIEVVLEPKYAMCVRRYRTGE